MKGYWGPLNPKPYRPLIGTLKATLKDLLKGILGSLGGPLKDTQGLQRPPLCEALLGFGV